MAHSKKAGSTRASLFSSLSIWRLLKRGSQHDSRLEPRLAARYEIHTVLAFLSRPLTFGWAVVTLYFLIIQCPIWLPPSCWPPHQPSDKMIIRRTIRLIGSRENDIVIVIIKYTTFGVTSWFLIRKKFPRKSSSNDNMLLMNLWTSALCFVWTRACHELEGKLGIKIHHRCFLIRCLKLQPTSQMQFLA